MKLVKTLAIMMALTTSVAWGQGRPAVQYLKINGLKLEGIHGRYAIPIEAFPQLMQGVVCNPALTHEDVNLELVVWDETDAYVLALLKVEYPGSQRAREQYVVTYKHESGVIDAVLACADGDMGYGEASFLQWQYDYRLRKFPTELTLDDDKHHFTVKRSSKTSLLNRGGPELQENCVWLKRYTVAENGIITVDETGEEWNVLRISIPNASVPGNKDKRKEIKLEQTETLSRPMLQLVEIYGTPVSDQQEPERFARLLDYDPEPDGDTGQEVSRYEDTMERYAGDVMTWAKRLMYRRPQLWAQWVYEHKGEQNLTQLLQLVFEDDPQFKAWFSDQLKSMPNAKMGKWWKGLMN